MIDLSGTRVVAIFAHPDDESMTIGGILAAFVERGATVTLITATRGEEGEIAHPSLATPENLGEVREQELRDAVALFGISDVRFLDYRDSGMFGSAANERPDAFIQQPLELVARRIAGLLEELRADIAFTFSEEGIYLHPDHMYIHEAVVAAVALLSQQPTYLYLTSFPHEFFMNLVEQDHDLFLDMPEERLARLGQPTEAFTLTVEVEPYIDRKLAAFKAHKTQQPAEGGREFIEDPELRRQFARKEWFMLASPPNGRPDPLARLAADLDRSQIDE